MPTPPPHMTVVKADHPSYSKDIPNTLETTLALGYTKKPQSTREGMAEQSVYTGQFMAGDEGIMTEYRLKLTHGPNLLDIIIQQDGKRLSEQRFVVPTTHIPIHDDNILVTYTRNLQTVRITAPESQVGLVDETYDPNELQKPLSVEPKRELKQKVKETSLLEEGTEQLAEQLSEQSPEQLAEEQQPYDGEPIVLRSQLKYSPMKVLEEIADRIGEPGIVSSMWSQAKSRARALTGTLNYTPLDTHGLQVPAERIEQFIKTELPSRYHNVIRVEEFPADTPTGEFKSLDVIREEFIRKDPVHGDTNFGIFLEEVAEKEEFTIGEQVFRRDELVQGDQVHIMLVDFYKDL